MTKKIRLLDPKLCFDLWIETGSVYKVPVVLKNKYGLYNEKTGQLFSPQGVWNAAGHYVIEHMAEARKSVEEVWKANGMLLNDKEWYRIVLERSNYLSKSTFDKFIEKHSYLKPYLNDKK